jgi:hypothetical protein
MACCDGDPLQAMPTNMVQKSFHSDNRPWSSVSNELETFEADGLVLGELSTKQLDVTDDDDEFR